MSVTRLAGRRGGARLGAFILVLVLGVGGFCLWYFVLRGDPSAGRHAKEKTGRFIPADVTILGGVDVPSLRVSPLIPKLGFDPTAAISTWPIPEDIKRFLSSAGLDLGKVTSITFAGRGLSPFGGPRPELLIIADGTFDDAAITTAFESVLAGQPQKIDDVEVRISPVGGMVVVKKRELVFGTQALFKTAIAVYTGERPSVDKDHPLGIAARGIDKKSTFWFTSSVGFASKIPKIPLVDLSPLRRVTHIAGSAGLDDTKITLSLSLVSGSMEEANALHQMLSSVISKALLAMVIMPGTGPFEGWLKRLEMRVEGTRVSLRSSIAFDEITKIYRGFRSLLSRF